MDNLPNCIKCDSEYTYQDGPLYICPMCGHEWSAEPTEVKEPVQVKDANGNVLEEGDSVTIIKDIKVKGSSTPIKVGTKVKGIRIVEEVNGHDLEGKVPGFGLMMLKSSIVKKSS